MLEYVRDKLEVDIDLDECFVIANEDFKSIYVNTYMDSMIFNQKGLRKLFIKLVVQYRSRLNPKCLSEFISKLQSDTYVEIKIIAGISKLPAKI